MKGRIKRPSGGDRVWSAIRYSEGQVDDVAITCDTFRLERMSRNSWWTAAYRGGKRVCFCIEWDRRQGRIMREAYYHCTGCGRPEKVKLREVR